MNEQTIEDIISALYDMVQDARALPLGADKCIVERDKVLDMLDEIIGQLPVELQRFGSTKDELFPDLRELRELYGDEADNFSTGAIGVYSYLNRIAFGLKHFAALNRKFDLKYIEKKDIFPLTRDAKDILDGKWMK